VRRGADMVSVQAGSLESGDVLLGIKRKETPGIVIQLTSPVKAQFGDRMLEVIRETLAQAGVDGLEVQAADRGALDYVIRARVLTAVNRLLNEELGQTSGKESVR
jgi:citrate lyase subunit gamma (acyl carrier protein)